MDRNSLERILVDLPTSIPSAAPKRKTQIRLSGHAYSAAWNARKGNRLGFPAADALASRLVFANSKQNEQRPKTLPPGVTAAMKSPICDMLGIEFPLLAFSHCRDVVAAVSRAGGFGVLGATAHAPETLER